MPGASLEEPYKNGNIKVEKRKEKKRESSHERDRLAREIDY